MFENYTTPAFDFHEMLLAIAGQFTLYIAGPAWCLCQLFRPLRATSWRVASGQLLTGLLGCLAMAGVVTFDPTGFCNWFLD